MRQAAMGVNSSDFPTLKILPGKHKEVRKIAAEHDLTLVQLADILVSIGLREIQKNPSLLLLNKGAI